MHSRYRKATEFLPLKVEIRYRKVVSIYISRLEAHLQDIYDEEI